MFSCCTNPCVPAPLQGLGFSIALTSSLVYINSFVFFGSLLGMLIHICILIGYANPLFSTTAYVSIAHLAGYAIVTTMLKFAHTDASIPIAALGITVVVIGTILAILSRPIQIIQSNNTPPKPLLQTTLTAPPENINIRTQPAIRERAPAKVPPIQEQFNDFL